MTRQQHEDSSVYGLAADDGAAPPPLHPALAEEMARSGAQPRVEDLLCPYCQQPLVAGSKICVYCGSDVSQVLAKQAPPMRGRPAPVPAPTVGPPAAPVAAPARQQPRASEDEPRRGKVGLIVIAIVLLVIGGVAIQGLRLIMRSAGRSAPSSSVAAAAAPTNEGDAAVLAQIKDEHGTEARAWLSANQERTLMSLSHAQSLGRVEDLYRLGAKQVIAFGSRISATAAVELPDDAAHRKAVFDWADRWNRDHRFDSDRDTGQKWLVIRMPF
jgi:hypothetical protein